MYDLDHMMNGKGSREHHQQMIAEAQRQSMSENNPSETPKRKSLPQRLTWVALAITQMLVK